MTARVPTAKLRYVYLNALGNQVATFAPGYKYPYVFKIFKDSTIQSFALPGGRIYGLKRMTRILEQADQIRVIRAIRG